MNSIIIDKPGKYQDADKKNLENSITFSNCLKLFGILLTMVFFASGCGLRRDYVVLSYDPQRMVEKLKRADLVKVEVEILDARTIRDKVGYMKNDWGVRIGPIIARNDVADLLKKAIEGELKNRGFELAPGSATVLAELNKYYYHFEDAGTWTIGGTGVADIVMNIQVKKPNKSILYSKLITEDFKYMFLRLTTGKDAKIALDRALEYAMRELFGDAAFIDSISKACLIE